MGRRCLACCHPDRSKIDLALLGGEPYAQVARRFGVPRKSLPGHLRHIPEDLARSYREARRQEVAELLRAHRVVMGKLVSQLAVGQRLDRGLLRRFGRLAERLAILGAFDFDQEPEEAPAPDLPPPPGIQEVLALLDRELNACSGP